MWITAAMTRSLNGRMYPYARRGPPDRRPTMASSSSDDFSKAVPLRGLAVVATNKASIAPMPTPNATTSQNVRTGRNEKKTK